MNEEDNSTKLDVVVPDRGDVNNDAMAAEPAVEAVQETPAVEDQQPVVEVVNDENPAPEAVTTEQPQTEEVAPAEEVKAEVAPEMAPEEAAADYPEKPVEAEVSSNDEPSEVGAPETEEAVVTVDEVKDKKSGGLMKIMMIILVVVLMVGLPIGAYMYRDMQAVDNEKTMQQEIDKLKKEKADLQTSLDTSEAMLATICGETKPTTENADNIKAALNTANTQPLEGYMAESVNVAYAASEGLGGKTPAEATATVTEFIAEAGSFTFMDGDSDGAADYRAGDYKDYFQDNSIIATASSDKVIVFTFDCDSKIDQILFVTDKAEL